MWLCRYFIWFMLYSCAGWIYESIVCSIDEKKLINRGFLNGPYCPIYGAGALLDIALLGHIENVAVLFFAGLLLTGVLEYFTSWLLEKLFHAQWWDYSEWKFNINGRVCLAGAVVFGFMSVVVIKIVHPFVEAKTAEFSDTAVVAAAVCLAVVIIADTVYTLMKFKDFNKKLEQLHSYIAEAVAVQTEAIGRAKNQIMESEAFKKFRLKAEHFKKKLNFQERRILAAFPKFKPIKYADAALKVREFISASKKKKQ